MNADYNFRYSRKDSKMERAGRMNKRQKLYELQHDHSGKKITLRNKRNGGRDKYNFDLED